MFIIYTTHILNKINNGHTKSYTEKKNEKKTLYYTFFIICSFNIHLTFLLFIYKIENYIFKILPEICKYKNICIKWCNVINKLAELTQEMNCITYIMYIYEHIFTWIIYMYYIKNHHIWEEMNKNLINAYIIIFK